MDACFQGKIADHVQKKGWFLGYFKEDEHLKSDHVEIAYQDISNKKPDPHDRHVHKIGTEIVIVISGVVHFLIDKKEYRVPEKEFFIIYPNTVLERIWAEDNTTIVLLKTPSVPNDKYFLPEETEIRR